MFSRLYGAVAALTFGVVVADVAIADEPYPMAGIFTVHETKDVASAKKEDIEWANQELAKLGLPPLEMGKDTPCLASFEVVDDKGKHQQYTLDWDDLVNAKQIVYRPYMSFDCRWEAGGHIEVCGRVTRIFYRYHPDDNPLAFVELSDYQDLKAMKFKKETFGLKEMASCERVKDALLEHIATSSKVGHNPRPDFPLNEYDATLVEAITKDDKAFWFFAN